MALVNFVPSPALGLVVIIILLYSDSGKPGCPDGVAFPADEVLAVEN